MRFLLAALIVTTTLVAVIMQLGCQQEYACKEDANSITTRCVELCQNNDGMDYTTVDLKCSSPGVCLKKRFGEYCRCNNGGTFVR